MARKWVEFFVDNPKASIAFMRSFRKQDLEKAHLHSKKEDPRIVIERFLKDNGC